jgi:beta-N-acetylhexosaminidase
MSRWPRLVALLTSLALLATGCTDDAGGADGGNDEEPQRAEQEAPPTPAERLGLRTGWGPTHNELNRAARYALRMPLDRLAGQVIVAHWTGTQAPLGMVRRLHLGGVIAFDGNVASPEQIRRVNRTLQRGVRRPWPLLISVDQEGGPVARVGSGATRFPAFMSVGAADDEELTTQAHRAAGGELRSLGFTMDFAPVADVVTNPSNVVIGVRSASSDPDEVTEQVLAASRGLSAGGVVPVVKHFPGHGSVSGDSHVLLPVQRRSRQRLEAVDWKPFREAVDAGLPAVMVGHLDVRAIDRGKPSSLSRPVVTGALRGDLGFEGLVVTDALNMGAVTRGHSSGQAAVAALRAGVDVALMPADPAAARAGIIKAVRTGRLEKRRLQQAAARQIALLLHHEATARGGRAPGSSGDVSRRLSARALTSVAGPCDGRIAPGRPIPTGDSTAVANFRVAAGNAGLPLGTVEQVREPRPVAPKRPPKKAKPKVKKRYQAALRTHRRELAKWRRTPPRTIYHGTPLALVGDGDAVPSSSYVVAVGSPYVLGRTDAQVRVATYGDTIGAMTALVSFLLGKAPAPGRLPVEVAGVRDGCD